MTVHLIVEASGKGSPAMTRFEFAHGRITIGRASTNDWVLDDPDHVISKTHCELKIDDAGVQVTDRSSNGIYLNGAFSPLGRGNSELLSDGDRLQIGEYIIRVEIEAQGEDGLPGSPFDQVGGEDLTEVIAPKPEPALGERGPFAGESSGGQPFEEEVVPVRGPDPLGLDETPDEAVPGRPAASDHLPFDAHFMPSPAFEERAREESAPPAKPAEAGPSPGKLLPDDWDAGDLLGPDVDAEQLPGEAREETAGSSFDAVLPEAPEQRPGAEETERRVQVPEETADREQGPLPAGPVPASRIAERDQAVPESGPAGGGGAASLFSAFLESAGIRMEGKGLDAERVARKSGVLFRKMLEGMVVLLQARMVVKNEYQLERTLLRPVANNPLKSLPSVDEILAVLYRTDDTSGVWLDAEAAVDEAVQDLKSHDLALVAGMNAVVEHFVAALDPGRFEEGGGDGVKRLLSISALEKAKGWDRFEAEYAMLRKTLEEGLTGEARAVFERAYNREKQRLEG